MADTWHSRISSGYHKFSDDTSIHGFREMYYSKLYFWKMAWLIIIGAALGITSYQVYEAIYQYRFQNYNTAIQPATGDQVIYPHLKFCIQHWMDWIDWYKATDLGFSKETVLVGMSYLTNIYSNRSFDVQEAKRNFTLAMAANNLTSMHDFYRAVARNWALFPVPLFTHRGLFGLKLPDVNFVYFCYTANGTDILRQIRQNKADDRQQSKSNVLKLDYYNMDENFFGSEITPEERNSYTAEWISQKTLQYTIDEMTGKSDGYAHVIKDYLQIHPPHVMFIDGYSKSDIKILPEVDEYLVNVRASAHVWKNSKENPCTFGARSFVTDSSCSDYCWASVNYCPLTCSNLENVILLPDVNEPTKLCQNHFYFINPEVKPMVAETTNTVTVGTTDKTSTSSTKATTTVSCVYNEALNAEKYTKCMANCSEGCEKWSFDIAVTTRSIYSSIHTVAHKTSTVVYVQYPLDGDILIMTETDSQTWENLVGNVGGLLGIWTGASVVSFFQLFYLCCCAEKTLSETFCPRRLFPYLHELHNQVGEKPGTNVSINDPVISVNSCSKKKRLRRLKTILIKP